MPLDKPAPLLPHGGRLRAASARYGIPLGDWLDLSTGINPHAWPVPPVPPSHWQRLPDDDDDLENSACDYYQCPHVLAVAGSQAALQSLPRLRATGRVGILYPSYNEHAHAWRIAGHEVVELSATQIDRALSSLDVLVLVNPNNPDGTRFSRETLLRWRQLLAARDGWLIVDEAFGDAHRELSIADHSGLPGTIVLRSLGKFFGMAGARVGFVCAEVHLLNALRAHLGPWPVAAPSRWAAILALNDTAWHARMRDVLLQSSARLASLLARHALPPNGGGAFFQYTLTPRAEDLHTALARRGILARYFTEPMALRWGLPPDDAAFTRLDDALMAVRREIA